MTKQELTCIINFDDEKFVPEYATSGSSGMDLRAYLNSSVSFRTKGPEIENRYITIRPGDIVAIPAGFTLKLPEGYEAQIRSRSGLALHNGIVVLNSPATIDQDYTGMITMIIANQGTKNFVISYGDRIAQMVISKVEHIKFEKHDVKKDVKNEESTLETIENDIVNERQENGFGSTGIK